MSSVNVDSICKSTGQRLLQDWLAVGIITQLIAQISPKLMSSLNTFALMRKQFFTFFETYKKLLCNQVKRCVLKELSVCGVYKCMRCMYGYLHVIMKINEEWYERELQCHTSGGNN
jgi:hypothetical protein